MEKHGAAKTSKQSKAGVTLSVARMSKILRRSRVAKQVGSRAPVYLAGAVEALLRDVLGKARSNAQLVAHPKAAKRVNVADIIAGVRTDPDLARLFAGYTFASTAPARKAVAYCLPPIQQKERRQRIKSAKLKREERRTTSTSTSIVD
jgi:histone H3/H4